MPTWFWILGAFVLGVFVGQAMILPFVKREP